MNHLPRMTLNPPTQALIIETAITLSSNIRERVK
jgi:hypothetical protein